MPENFEKNRGEEESIPERTSGLMKVVGVLPKIEKEILSDVGDKYFGKQEKYDIEREKTPEELKIIEGILNYLPDFVKKYGGMSVPLTPEHIHIADYHQLTDEEKKLLKKKHAETKGAYNHVKESVLIVVNEKEDNNLNFAQLVAHELMHFSSFQSADLENKNSHDLNAMNRITGLSIRTGKNDKEIYFDGFNEAMTEELAMRFGEEFFESIDELSKNIETRNNIRDRYSIGEEKAKRNIANVITKKVESGPKAGMWKSTILKYSYPREREMMTKIIDDIYNANKNDFESSEKVFDIFAKAYFTGNILPIARLVEKTFGKGSFRKLGEETKKEK